MKCDILIGIFQTAAYNSGRQDPMGWDCFMGTFWTILLHLGNLRSGPEGKIMFSDQPETAPILISHLYIFTKLCCP